jgi:hypothetical protein
MTVGDLRELLDQFVLHWKHVKCYWQDCEGGKAPEQLQDKVSTGRRKAGNCAAAAKLHFNSRIQQKGDTATGALAVFEVQTERPWPRHAAASLLVI